MRTRHWTVDRTEQARYHYEGESWHRRGVKITLQRGVKSPLQLTHRVFSVEDPPAYWSPSPQGPLTPISADGAYFSNDVDWVMLWVTVTNPPVPNDFYEWIFTGPGGGGIFDETLKWTCKHLGGNPNLLDWEYTEDDVVYDVWMDPPDDAIHILAVGVSIKGWPAADLLGTWNIEVTRNGAPYNVLFDDNKPSKDDNRDDVAWFELYGGVAISVPAGVEGYVRVNEELQLDCEVEQPGGSYLWTKVSGPGNVTFDGQSTSSARNPKFKADTVGSYTVKVDYTTNGTVSDTVVINVIEVDLTECDEEWLPEGARNSGPGNSTSFTVTVTPSIIDSKEFEFQLRDVSAEEGMCINYGNSMAKDLQFLPQAGFTISGSDNQFAKATTTDNTAVVTVTSYDFGAWGNIRCELTLDGKTFLARVEGGQDHAHIPRDDNSNQIADAWQYDSAGGSSGASDDNDNPGAGVHESSGDGLSRYEEYRGLYIFQVHTRTSPVSKQLFVYDGDDMGFGYFSETGIYAVQIDHVDFGGCSLRRINLNWNHANIAFQHGIWLEDYDIENPYVWGQAGSDGSPGQRDGSIRIDLTKIANRIDEPYTESFTDTVIAHELGHGVDIQHHMPWPHTGGETDCVIRYWTAWEWMRIGQGHPEDVTLGDTYCSTDDECYGQINVVDPD